MSKERTYILFDSRACGGDTGNASVLEVCDTEEEAREACGMYGGMACYSYERRGKILDDQRFEWNWFPQERKQKRKSSGAKR